MTFDLQKIDWTAVGSLATLLAVVLALGLGVYPIWRQRAERKAIADNVRGHLLTVLASLESKCHAWLSARSASCQIDQVFVDRIAELRSLYPHLIVLKPIERSHVGVVCFTASLFHSGTEAGTEALEMIVSQINAAQAVMVRKGKRGRAPRGTTAHE